MTVDTIGDTTNYDNFTTYVIAGKITASASGSLTSLGVNLQAAGGAYCRLAIYSHNAGSNKPASLLGESASVGQGGLWNDLAVTGVTIVQGTDYWIGFQQSGGSAYDEGSDGTTRNSYYEKSYSAFDATWSAGSTERTIYCPNLRMTYTAVTTYSKTYGVDTLLKKLDITKTFGVDVDLKKLDLPTQLAIDALLRKLDLPKTIGIDAIIKKVGTESLGIDAVLKKEDVDKTFGVDADLKKLNVPATMGIDADLKKLDIDKAFGADTALASRIPIAYAIDILLKKLGVDKTFGADTYLKKLNLPAAYAIDVLLQKVGLPSPFALDALLAKLDIPESFGVDTHVKKEDVESSFGVDTRLAVATTVSIQPEADAFVQSQYNANNNYGSAAWWIASITTYPLVTRSYLRFALSSIPAGSTIISAKLYMYVYEIWGTGGTDRIYDIHFVSTDSWVESTITWNNKPAVGTVLINDTTISTVGWKSYDVTDQVATEYAGDGKISLCLKDYKEGDGGRYLGWTAYSKEYANSDYHPYLEVTYSNPYSTYTQTFGVDALTKKLDIPTQLGIDTILSSLILERTFAIDAHLKKLDIPKTFGIDALTVTRVAISYAIDAVLKKLTVAKTFGIDAVLTKRYNRLLNVDAVLKKLSATKTFSVDALLKKLDLPKTFAIDAMLSSTKTAAFGIDTDLLKELSAGFAIDSDLMKTEEGTFSVDATLQKLDIPAEFALDAVLSTYFERSFAIDAVLLKQFSAAFGIDGHLQKKVITVGFAIDAYLVPYVHPIVECLFDLLTDTSDFVLLTNTAQFELLTNTADFVTEREIVA